MDSQKMCPIVEDEGHLAVGRLQRVGRSVDQRGHLEVNVVITGVGLGDEFVDGRHGLAVELPRCQVGRVHLIGVDHRALEIGDQNVFGCGADFPQRQLCSGRHAHSQASCNNQQMLLQNHGRYSALKTRNEGR